MQQDEYPDPMWGKSCHLQLAEIQLIKLAKGATSPEDTKNTRRLTAGPRKQSLVESTKNSRYHKMPPRKRTKKNQRPKRLFYSPALNRLVEICLAKASHTRPTAHRIYKLCCQFAKLHREQLCARERGDQRNDVHHVHLGQPSTFYYSRVRTRSGIATIRRFGPGG